MNTPAPQLTAEVKAVKEAYDALNRNDVPAFIQLFDRQIERVELIDPDGAAIYRGLDALRTHVELHRGNWAEGSCEPQRFVVVGNRIVVSVQVRVRVRNESEWREGLVTDVFSFKGGKAYEFRTFIDSKKALEWTESKTPDSI